MRWVGRFVAFVWHQCRTSWFSAHENLRPRSPASGLLLFLFVMFFLVGLVLVLLGFDLNALDLWLDEHGHWLHFVGSWLFRLLCGAILAICVLTVLGGLWQKFMSPRSDEEDAASFAERIGAGEEDTEADQEQPAGWGCMVLAVIVGYFAWFGVMG